MLKLLLIDGNSMLFRAYFATAYGQPMSTSNGIPTNAIFGFASMLHKAVETIQPDRIVVAFDAGKDNFRKEIFADYKGNRQETPSDLVAQFPIAREYLDSIHMLQYEQEGIEADDIIGSLAKMYPQYDINVLTSDKDLLQIVNGNTRVWLMKKGITEMECMDEKGVWDRFELKPVQIIDLKGLSGDSSDNIPGVRKVGDKTAVRLLKDYGSVEGVYQHIDEIKGKLQENLINDKETAFMSKRLAAIKTDAEILLDLEKAADFDFQSQDAVDFYVKYEMRTFLNNLSGRREKDEDKLQWQLIRKFAEGQLTAPSALFFNGDDKINGVAVVNESGNYYMEWQDCLSDSLFIDFLNSKNEKIVYDVKKLYHLLHENALTVKGRIVDMMIVTFLFNSKIKTLNDLLRFYHIDLVSKGGKQLDLFDEQEDYSRYVQTAKALFKKAPEAMQHLERLEMSSLYWDLELPLAELLYDMEMQGVRVKAEVLDRIAQETAEKLEVIEKRIHDLAGRQFNINSPKQLAEIIYDDLGLMRSSKRSTDASILKKMEHLHPIINEILEYRKYAKLNSTYAIGLKKYIQADGKIHTEYNQCIAETGRLSSSNPNLQNISVRNEETREIRAAFIPDEGCVFVGADYSQVELRILAHMSNEESLIQAFKEGMDIHTKTAMDIFNVEADEVSSLMRRQSKAINFGIDYGMSDFGLAEQLGIPVKQAKEFINSYFQKYPNVKKYMNDIVESCREKGYVTTLMNRRREIPEIKSSNYSLREFGKRAAMNAPIQGSAADLIKVAMLNVYRRLNKENLQSKLILQIHDELILNVPLQEKERVMKLVKEEMENAMELKVPLLAESESGSTWLEVK